MRLLTLLLASALIIGCQPPAQIHAQAVDAVADAVEDSRDAIADPVEDAQRTTAEVLVPVVLQAQDIVTEALPPAPAPQPVQVSPAAVDLIVRFEVVSPSYYTRHLQGVICPGSASGPTRGIGWDDGHQTQQRIAAAWPMHPQLARILPASGQIGALRCKTYRNANRDIRTPLPMAQDVFAHSSLPTYHALAARTFQDGWDALPPDAQGALTATVYNRGASMRGDRRREMRVLRDQCVPAGDLACMAAQFRAMPRLWRGTDVEAGLTRRYEATAALAENAA